MKLSIIAGLEKLMCLIITILMMALMTAMFANTAQAVSVVLDGNNVLESGNACSTGAIYRFGTKTTYQGKPLDILLRILDEQNLQNSSCIEYNQASILLKFIAPYKTSAHLFADAEFTFVEKNTSTPVELNVITAIFKDLDRYITAFTDDVYLNEDHSVNLATATGVSYDATAALTSAIGVDYQGKLIGSSTHCEDNRVATESACKGIVSWKSLAKINVRLNTANGTNRHFLLSFDLDDINDIDLGTDHGDAPLSYGDASHSISSKLSIGSGTAADSEPNAIYSSNADGDDTDTLAAIDYDDDDGVSSFSSLTDGDTNYQLDIVATNVTTQPAKLIGWIDFNGNGVFESSEASSVNVPVGSNATTFPLQWIINTSIPTGNIYARFRLSTDPALTTSTATGFFFDGEVEDYNLTTAAAQPFACNSDSYVFVSDGASSPTFASIIDLANNDSKSANEGLAFHSSDINATGYNLKDGYIWGYDQGNDKVVRVGSDYKVETYTIAGLPAEQFHLGDVSPEGVLFLASRNFNGTEIYKVDVNPLSVGYKTYMGKLDLKPAVHSDVLKREVVEDFALHPFDKHLYFIGWRNGIRGILYKVNTDTGLVIPLGNIGIPLSINPNTTWFDVNGFMYFNNEDNIYRIDLSNAVAPNPKANLYTALTVSSFGDAARCSRAPVTNHDYDYGDAPDTYGTDDTPGNSATAADSIAAKHIINPLIKLGAIAPDVEQSAFPSVDALGDNNTASNDEEAITSFPPLDAATTTYSIAASSIKLSNTTGDNAILYAYIDFNRDGDFTDPQESTSVTVAAGAVAPSADLRWTNLSGLDAGDTFARFRLSTDTTLTANGMANDGEVEDYKLNIDTAAACIGFTGSTNAGISPVTQLRQGEKFFIASTQLSPLEGHLTAYSLGNNGLPDQSLWDAATLMTNDKRLAALYSTDVNGIKIAFNDLDAAAFNSGGTPTVLAIKGYTLNPSFGSGSPYLGARKANSFLGAISPDSNLALLGNSVDTYRLLNDATYRAFYNTVVSTRSATGSTSNPARILLGSDDGFLYAFNQHDGELGWGWMPRTLATELKTADSFYQNHFMQGKIDIVDLKGASNYASYVIGSYKAGLGQYVLRLSSNGGLDSVIWDTDHHAVDNANEKAPNFGERAYFSDQAGNVYTAYIVTSSSGMSILHIRGLTDDLTHHTIVLTFEATSSPYVMTDFASANAPAKKTLYIGGSNGKVYAAALLNNVNTLESVATLQTNINDSVVADLGVVSPITYIGASASSSDSNYYLRVQSDTRLTIFAYQSQGSSWLETWTTYVGGANKRDSGSATMVSDSTNIQALPSDAKITASAYIVSDSLVLPVALPPTGNSCYGTAHYYFYKLHDGHFPTKAFFNSNDNSEVTTPVTLGYGAARKLHIAHLPGADKLMGIGISDQKPNNDVGINKSFQVKDPVQTGIRSWRELR